MSGIIDTVGARSGIVGSDVYPAGHVIYHDYASISSGDSVTTMDDTYQTVTNATITVPAATANICSKMVIQFSGHTLVYRGGSHHFGQLRCYRTTPNATAISINKYGGTNEQGTGNPFYGAYTIICTDASLSNVDHTYILQKKSPNNYADMMSGGQAGFEIQVWGIK